VEEEQGGGVRPLLLYCSVWKTKGEIIASEQEKYLSVLKG